MSSPHGSFISDDVAVTEVGLGNEVNGLKLNHIGVEL
jgi:hypothetical protein